MHEKACILVVDDEDSQRKSLSLILKKKGYEVESAGTGKEALKKSEEKYRSLFETARNAILILNGEAEDKPQLFTKGFGRHTGLGHYLSREILSITGITITENGEPGNGARFGIIMPKGMWRIAGRGV
jgi:PAS domain-containing protein